MPRSRGFSNTLFKKEFTDRSLETEKYIKRDVISTIHAVI